MGNSVDEPVDNSGSAGPVDKRQVIDTSSTGPVEESSAQRPGRTSLINGAAVSTTTSIPRSIDEGNSKPLLPSVDDLYLERFGA